MPSLSFTEIQSFRSKSSQFLGEPFTVYLLFISALQCPADVTNCHCCDGHSTIWCWHNGPHSLGAESLTNLHQKIHPFIIWALKRALKGTGARRATNIFSQDSGIKEVTKPTHNNIFWAKCKPFQKVYTDSLGSFVTATITYRCWLIPEPWKVFMLEHRGGRSKKTGNYTSSCWNLIHTHEPSPLNTS